VDYKEGGTHDGVGPLLAQEACLDMLDISLRRYWLRRGVLPIVQVGAEQHCWVCQGGQEGV
jgi:hypothetical protein